MDCKAFREEYTIILKLKKKFLGIWSYTKHVTLRFIQASAYDVQYYTYQIKQEGFDNTTWLSNFVKDHSDIKDKDLKWVKYNHNTIYPIIQSTYFKGVFGQKKGTQSGGNGESFFESYIVFLSQHFKTDPLTLMQKYTYDQLARFTEGLIWNLNEQTKEGKKKNKLRTLQKKKDSRTPEEEERIRKLFSGIRQETNAKDGSGRSSGFE